MTALQSPNPVRVETGATLDHRFASLWEETPSAVSAHLSI
jgi:hypothetical protein